MAVVNIVLDVPLSKSFSYYCSELIPVGTRVLVEFRNKNVVGFVWANDVAVETIGFDVQKLKPVVQIFAERLTAEVISLIKFTAEYYCYPVGQTLFSAIPSLFKKPKNINPPKSKTNIDSQFTVNDSQVVVGNDKIQLTPEQQQVFHQVRERFTSYHPCVLYGITGSGKTEVYLELIAEVIANKQQALVLVPEINLTPQLLARFKRRFKNITIHTLTSNTTPTSRAMGYLEAQSLEAKIIIGTRLSVFTPFRNLGIIIVDEEHDGSFKQNDGLRYHARDLAVWRAKANNIPIILGSATPSLETLYNYKLSKYTLYKLTRRGVDSAVLPQVDLIDLNAFKPTDGITDIALDAIEKRLQLGELSLVFINRRGYAPTINCYECAWVSQCFHCSTNMVFHTSNKQLKCHHCGSTQKVPKACPKCGSQYLRALGQGSQKIEEVLKNKFPESRIYRIDQDTINTKKAWQELYKKIHNNEVDILVGTQMLAKGHDFHNLTLVVGLNVDSSLYSYDFRASELLFTQLTQVAGRAGRGEKPGTVLLQTNYPKHELFQFLIKHDFAGFANFTLKQRKALNLPPYSYYVMLRSSGKDILKVMEYLTKIITAAAQIAPKGIIVYPAVPAIIQRLKNRERAQSLIHALKRNELHQFLNDLTNILDKNKPKGGITWNLDIDPLEA